jgi:predicted 3-demethylubiquinone-9 3-methyltransferase (glyoxalase superfamily)
MSRGFSTFLMFQGGAEEALDLYVSLFKGEVDALERYGPGEQGPENGIKQAAFRLGDQRFRCFDSPAVHEFTFTPAVSIFVDCENEGELEEAFERLAEGGQVLMPLDNYGFSRRFAWVADRFGVSWQLNLE